ncbi:MAG: LacI family transcriptional regulator [Dehalococcoidia bacterium]|nr:LacI family transcriptional regulator [Dehalococcoidia bacterium]
MDQHDATVRDVAREAGVSVATASRVLSGSGYPVRASVRARVLEVAQRMSYSANSYARVLSTQQSRLVGLMVPSISEPFFSEIARGAERFLSARGYLIVLCDTDREPETEHRYLNELRGLRSGAILVAHTAYGQELLDAIAIHPAPVVVIGRDLPCASVQLDNRGAAAVATSHLIDLGHRRIAFVGGAPTSLAAVDRLAGFKLTMSQRGIPVDEALIMEGDFSLESAALAMRSLLAGSPPDAVLAANDVIAIGVIHEAVEQGLSVPRGISVVGINDTPIAAFMNPALTTVSLPMRKAGEAAAELLLQQMETQTRSDVVVSLAGELVVRGSTLSKGH